MRKFLLTISLAISLFCIVNQAHAVSWTYSRSITVTSTGSIASGTLSNFPMLVSSTLASWKSSSNGGKIQNLVTNPNGGQMPADLVFATSTANCTNGNYLNFENDVYTSSTGALVSWVNVPSMATGTVIYACYDASGVTTDQSHPSSTWNSNYQVVSHFGDGKTLSLNDSTKNNLTWTNSTGVGATSSPFGGAALFSGDQLVGTSTFNGCYTVDKCTVEFWVSNQNTSQASTYVFNSVDSELTVLYGYVASTYESYGGLWGRNTIKGGVSDTGWHSVALAFDPNLPVTNAAYYDGAQSYNLNTGNALITANNGVYLGSAGGSNYFTSNVTEWRVSNVLLSSQWLTTEYNNQKIPDDASAGGFYHVGAETAFGGSTNYDPFMLADCF